MLLIGFQILPLLVYLVSAHQHVNMSLPNGSRLFGLLLKSGPINVAQFLGIPYAEPLLGSRRFMRPMAKKGWKKPLDCTSYRHACIQYKLQGLPVNVAESEDCLFLNVWTPKTTKDKPNETFPTMMYVHGGGYQMGAGSDYNGTVLASKNQLIVITINYRLSSFGFLLLEGTDAKGNQGLWDQRQALLWIKQNIKAFGGDPARVTIFGESAGGGSVGSHVLSPKSRKLFQSAICQSGVPTAAWAIESRTQSKKTSMDLAEKVGCFSNTSAQILSCLRNINATDLDFDFLSNPPLFKPMVDAEFLPKKSETIQNAGNFKGINLMTGYNSNEGWMLIILAWPKLLDISKNLTKTQFITNYKLWKDAVVKSAQFRTSLFENDKLVESAVLHEYSRWKEPVTSFDRQNSLEQLIADALFICPMLEFVGHSAKTVPTYVYRFNGIGKILFPGPEWMGSLHLAELEYLFGMPFEQPEKYSAKEKALSEKLQESFANFAKTGNPSFGSFVWPKYREESQQFMNFASSQSSGVNQWLPVQRCQFWNDYIPKISKEYPADIL